MKKYFSLVILAILMVGAASELQNVRALSWSFEDAIWVLSVNGPNIVKPGNNATFTISGTLYQTRNETIHIRIYLNTTIQAKKVILEIDSLPLGSYLDGFYFTRQHNVTIPINALNNDYIRVDIETTDKHFNSVIVSLVQDPTYSSLQSTVSSLQSQIAVLNTKISNYTTQISNLNTQISTLETAKLSLQTQIDSITAQLSTLIADKTSLQNQVNTLNQNITSQTAQINTLKTEKTTLQTQVNSLTNEKNNLTTQVNTLTTEKNNLTTQLIDWTNQANMYKNFAYGLGVLALIAIVVAIYFLRKPQST